MMLINVTFHLFHRIWSFSALNVIWKGASFSLWVVGLPCNDTLLQSLPGESQSVAHPADLLVPLEENKKKRTWCVNWQRHWKWGGKTIHLSAIHLSGGGHPFCCRPAGCLRVSVPLFSNGGLDFHRIPLLLLCGVQHCRIWRFCQRPESSAPEHPSVPGCKLSGDAARGVLHLLPLQCPLLDHQAGTELFVGHTGADARQRLLLQVPGPTTFQVLSHRTAAYSPMLLGRQHSAEWAGAKGHVLRPHYGVNTSASESRADDGQGKIV